MIELDLGQSATASSDSGRPAIGIDADDTLWHWECVFLTEYRIFAAFTSAFRDANFANMAVRLLKERERLNTPYFGFGIRAFLSSLREVALDVSGSRLAVNALIAQARMRLIDACAHPVLLEGADAALMAIQDRYPILITRGDEDEQLCKLKASGLQDYFHSVEVVPQKDEQSYREVMGRQGINPTKFLMVGNSAYADILPIVRLGGLAAHIPYPLTWAAEPNAALNPSPRLVVLESIRQLPDLLIGQ